MNLLEELKNLNPEILEFIHQDILDHDGNTIGSRCYGMTSSGDVLSGGTASTKENALRIAVAEAFERSLFCKIIEQDNLKYDFNLINFPSTSGFAAGFDDSSTRFRAICEGVERWAWSKWIDQHFQIEKDTNEKKLSKLSSHLEKDFLECRWFKKDFEVEISPKDKMNLSLVIFLGLTEDGIFPGSRVSTDQDDLYEHPIIEAHRNLINFKLHKIKPMQKMDIIEQRTMHFGNNKTNALSQIEKAIRIDWPKIELQILRKYETNIPDLFLYRCLFKDFIGWHAGDVDRFVY